MNTDIYQNLLTQMDATQTYVEILESTTVPLKEQRLEFVLRATEELLNNGACYINDELLRACRCQEPNPRSMEGGDGRNNLFGKTLAEMDELFNGLQEENGPDEDDLVA